MEEAIINHDILKTHAFNNTPKFWFEFVKKFLYNTIQKDNHQISRKSLTKTAKQFMMKIKMTESLVPNCDDYNISHNQKCYFKKPRPDEEPRRNICDRVCETCGIFKILYLTEIKIRPTGHVVLSKAQVRNVDKLSISYKLIFQLHTNLRLNITLTYVHLNPPLKRIECNHHKLTIQSENYCHVYCGLLSNFVSVPRKPSFHLQIKVQKPNGVYHVDFTYSITDPGRVVTTSIQCRKYYKEPSKWLVYFPKTAIFLYRFIVKIEVYLRLTFILATEMRKAVDIYDGPGTLCPKLKPFIKTDANITYITSSFLSMIYFKSGYPNATMVKYVSHKNIVSKHMSQVETSLDKLSYPTNECNNTNSVCIIKMKTKPWLHFNVTIMNIYHKYTEKMLCNYGGIALYDIVHSEHTYLSKLCYNHPGKYHYQNIYSKASTAKLVLYAYRKYGPFSVTLEVTTTRCQAFTIDVCKVHHQNVEVNSCVIFQLKQGSNKYFEENNLYSDWMFCRADWDRRPFEKIGRQRTMGVKFIG